LNGLLRDGEEFVAFVLAYCHPDTGEMLPMDAGKCPDRLAIAAQEYYASKSNKYGTLKVFFEKFSGDSAPTLENLHESIGFKISIPPTPLIPRDILLGLTAPFISIASSIPEILAIYLVGPIARDYSAHRDVDLLVVADSCPLQGVEDNLDERIDFFCFNSAEFREITRGGYQISKCMRLLYQRD
jgi:hypothetical protein